MKYRNIVSKEECNNELKLNKDEIISIFFYARVGLMAMEAESNELYKKIDEEMKRLCEINCN